LDNSNALFQGTPKANHHFLLRFSDTPGSFTIQTSKNRCRVVYTPGEGYKPQLSEDNQIFPTYTEFVDWINQNMKGFTPLPSSEFSEVFGNDSTPSPNLYVPPSAFTDAVYPNEAH